MAYHLTHPDSEQEIERAAEDVPTLLTQGWVTKAGTTPAGKAKAKAGGQPNAKAGATSD